MKKALKLIITLTLALLVMCTSTFAATIGQSLASPEAGWKRFDDTDSRIMLNGTLALNNFSGYYMGTDRGTWDKGGSFKFRFYGTKFRIIGSRANNRSSSIIVKCDGMQIGTFTEVGGDARCAFVYEHTGLDMAAHTIELINNTTGFMDLDAIDIDDTGYLISYYQPTNLKVTEVEDKKVTLQWNTVEDATSYNVYYGTSSGTVKDDYSNSKPVTVTDSVYGTTDVEGLTNGTTYYFRVSAIVNGEERELSNEVSATPKAEEQPSTDRIMLKTDDGLIYFGDLVEQTSEIFKLKNVYLYNGIPSFASNNQPTYDWEISFFKNKVIWFYLGE